MNLYVQSLFCVICNSPLKKSGNAILKGLDNGEARSEAVCSSCQYQILPKDTSFLGVLLSTSTLVNDRPDSSNDHKLSRWHFIPRSTYLVSMNACSTLVSCAGTCHDLHLGREVPGQFFVYHT